MTFQAVCVCGMCVQDKLQALVKASQAYQEQPAEMEALWDSCSCLLYSLEDKQKQLGLGDKVPSLHQRMKSSAPQSLLSGGILGKSGPDRAKKC